MEKSQLPEQIIGKEGWLESEDGAVITVNFQREFKSPVNRLWSLITDPKELQRWSPGFRFLPELGGKYELWFEEEPSGPPHIQGRIEAFQAPNLLQLGSIIFRLEAINTGCRLKFSDTLVLTNSSNNLEVALTVLAGWHRYLDLLEQALSQQTVQRNITEPDYSSIVFVGRHLVT